LAACIQPHCATGPGNANVPGLKYVLRLLGSGPRQVKKCLKLVRERVGVKGIWEGQTVAKRSFREVATRGG
jgi:hypothetical protein